MTDPRSGRLNNGTINYNHNSPAFNPYGQPQQQQQHHHQQQPGPYNMGYPIPYYGYAPPPMYHDPSLAYGYPSYMNPQAPAAGLPPMPHFYNQQQQQHHHHQQHNNYNNQNGYNNYNNINNPNHSHNIYNNSINDQTNIPHSNGNSTNATTTKKKLTYKNQFFVPQRDHNQYLQKLANNNNTSQPYNPQSSNNTNNSALSPAPSTSSTSQTTPDQNNTILSPPLSIKLSTPKLTHPLPSKPQLTQPQETQSIFKAEDVNGNYNGLTFQIVSSQESVSLPLFIGTNEEKLSSQKMKFKEIEDAKKKKEEQERLAEEQKKIAEQRAKAVGEEEKQQEVKEQSKQLQRESTPSTAATTPSPEPANPTIAKWSFIAEKAAKKNSPKSVSPSVTASPSVNKDERYVPSVSNVLEPLGVVLLRSMFDKNFQKAYNNKVLPNIVPRGLVNTGNICFMSSILQALLYCQPFYQILNIISIKTIRSLGTTSSTPLIDAVIELFKNFNVKLDQSSKNKREFGDSFVPEQFYKQISKHPRFSHLQWGQQEDAEEFLGYLLDGLHEEFIASVKTLKPNDVKSLLDSITNEETRNLIKQSLKIFSKEEDFNSKNESNGGSSALISDDGWHEVSGTKKKISAKRTVEVKPSPIRQLFGGQFRSVLDVPKQRESQSITLDPFQQIQLDISDEGINSLEDAFKHISQIEELPYKSNDGSDVIAKKQTFIDKLPEVLVVHLKRFSYVNKSSNDSKNDYNNNGYTNHSIHRPGRIEKIRKRINYQHDFNVPVECISTSARKFSPISKYKLIGVVYHHGISSEGGHYTVDVLKQDENKWIRIDDTNIQELKPEEVLNGGDNNEVKTAYILIYQKVVTP